MADKTASQLITARIKELGDWRGEKLTRVRKLIHEADPAIVEEWKWETPVWSRDGIICTGETYKQVVKLTFAKGAFLKDPRRLFNASLTGKMRRAIDLRAEDDIDADSFRDLIRRAVQPGRSMMLRVASKAADEAAHPRCDQGHGREGDGPCGRPAPEPLPYKPLMNPLADGQHDGGHDADHDGREQPAKEQRSKTVGDTHAHAPKKRLAAQADI